MDHVSHELADDTALDEEDEEEKGSNKENDKDSIDFDFEDTEYVEEATDLPITETYNIELQVGQSANKKINYTNTGKT